MAFCTSLEGQTVSSLTAYATSAFSKHSLISTVLVVQNVVNGEIIQRNPMYIALLTAISCDQTSHGQGSRRLRPL